MRAAVFFRIDDREDLPGYRDFPDLPDVQQVETDSIDPIIGSAVIVAVVPLGEWMSVRE